MHEFFTNTHVVEGQKLADSLLKRMQSESPQSAMIAFAQAFVMAAQACKMHKSHSLNLIGTLINAINNPTVNTAQEAASRLIVPGRV